MKRLLRKKRRANPPGRRNSEVEEIQFGPYLLGGKKKREDEEKEKSPTGAEKDRVIDKEALKKKQVLIG